MSKKAKALKALLWLAIAVAVCMYFSRTIQTITTPKVQLVQATNGRIEQKLRVNAAPHFPVETEYTLAKAQLYPITVDRVYVKPGLFVQAGDVLFTATLQEYESKSEELLNSYNEKAQALIDLDIANRKSSKQSMQNDLYDLMVEKQEALSNAENAARLAAAAEGIELPFDSATWAATANAKGASDSVKKQIDNVSAAQAASEAARTDFFASYENKQIKVSDEVFKYINDRNQLLHEMEALSDANVALLEARQSLSTVTAPTDGYVVAMDVKAGEPYQGQAVAFTLAKKEDAPILRVDVTDLEKTVEEGARVEAEGQYSTIRTKVTAVVDETDGRRYAEIELDDELLRAAGGMSSLMQNGSVEVQLVFRASKSATIIPASALRNDGSSDYVFVTEYQYGGFLSSSNYVARKQTVTVIDRSDSAVSIQEDLSYQSIINRADRAIEDGKPVMEYVE